MQLRYSTLFFQNAILDMKEKDDNTNLAARQTGKVNYDGHLVSLLYSSGEDFYEMYHIDREADPGIDPFIAETHRKTRKN